MSNFPEIADKPVTVGCLVRITAGKYRGRMGHVRRITPLEGADTALDIELNGRHEVQRIYVAAVDVQRIGGAS